MSIRIRVIKSGTEANFEKCFSPTLCEKCYIFDEICST